MSQNALFTPICFGGITNCKNRIVMAPLTRLRADFKTGVLPDYAVDYYQQRATAGLIIVEATNISPIARGYVGSPGIYSTEQIAQWRQITDAIHARGGKVVCQLWHTGVVGHESLHPGRPVQGPSTGTWECRCNIEENGVNIRAPCSPSQEMTKAEIAQTIQDYAQATRNAEAAGFDGVEIHAAHSYLLCSFMFAHTNKRTDEYGCQTFENRARFLFEVIAACKEAAYKSSGKCHVGVRVSPYGIFNAIHSGPDSHEFAKYLFTKLDKEQLAYVHISEPDWARGFSEIAGNQKWDPEWDLTEARFEDLRACLKETKFIGSGAYTTEKARSRINKLVDAVAFGRAFISNPDLVERIRNNWPFTPFNPQTSYHGGKTGYVDYPTYADQQKQQTATAS